MTLPSANNCSVTLDHFLQARVDDADGIYQHQAPGRNRSEPLSASPPLPSPAPEFIELIIFVAH